MKKRDGGLTVHQDCLSDIVCVVASHDVIHIQHRSPSVKCLSSKYAAECAVVFSAYLRHNCVHGPAIQLVVRENFKWHIILLLIPFDCL